MLFNGLHDAILQSRIVRYSVKLEFAVDFNGNHDSYSLDGSSLQDAFSLVAVVPIVQDMLNWVWISINTYTVLQFYSKAT